VPTARQHPGPTMPGNTSAPPDRPTEGPRFPAATRTRAMAHTESSSRDAAATRISIVIPAFNAAPLIGRCLDGLARQTLPPHEVLVMDGGSTDGTAAVVQGRAAQLSGLRWFSAPDRGIYDAMNKGLAQATGDWVFFLGADDRLHDDDVLRQIAAHLDEGTDFVHGDVVRVTKQRIEGGPYDHERLCNQNICHQAIFYRRSLLQRVGSYNLDYPVYADWDLNLRCFAAGCRPRHVPLVVSLYDGGGFSATRTDHRFLDDKLALIARYHQVGPLGRPLRPLRHEFHARAMALMAQRRWRAALGQFLTYAWHGAMVRVDRLRGA
jgi:glycosyltransferase involved in cell wall biosynthesis